MPTRLTTFLFISALAAASLTAQSRGDIAPHDLLLSEAPSAIDSAGNVYQAGVGGVSDVTPGAAQTQAGGGLCPGPHQPVSCTDVLIVKANPLGLKLFATLLGGATNDYAQALTVDPAGNTYVIGGTGGSFPTTAKAAIATSTTSNTFAAKLSPDGSTFLYVTYLPDIIQTLSNIAVDAQGNAYVAAQTKSGHACVIKISADGSSFVYTAVLAGSNQESASAVWADAAGNAYVTGSTSSPDFPVSPGVVQTQLAGAQNAFVTKLDPNGNIVFSTFLGGSGKDQGGAAQADRSGHVYVAGSAASLDFPTTQGAFQPAPLVPAWGRTPQGFFARLAPDGSSVEFASYIWAVSPTLAIGSFGDWYLAGQTGPGFPVTPSAPMPCVPGNYDIAGGVVVAHFDTHGSLLDATYVLDDFAFSLALASDGSVLLGGDRLTQIRFGSGLAVPTPCMTLTVFNAATQAVSDVAPGEWITLLGLGIGPKTGAIAAGGAQAPVALGGVQVLFDGVPAPLYYAQSGQVNALAPFELSGQTSTNVMLQYNGATFGPITVGVRFGDPGLFRAQPNVSALALVLNEDGTQNGPSNPAGRGSTVTLFGTGLGSINPACPTGGMNGPGPTTLTAGLSVVVQGGGPVQSAGGAPGLACGIEQIVMQVPATAQPGALSLTPNLVLNPPGGPMTGVDPSAGGSVIYVK